MHELLGIPARLDTLRAAGRPLFQEVRFMTDGLDLGMVSPSGLPLASRRELSGSLQ